MSSSFSPTADGLPAGRIGLSDEATARASDDVRPRWYVLHTKSRQEKTVGNHLAAKKASYFLPLIPQVRFYGRRKVTVDIPMFPGYVFLFGDRDQAFDADRTKRLARIIEVADQGQMEWEIENLRIAVDKEVPFDLYPYLREGIRAEVRSGPLSGLQGVIEQRLRPERLLLQVDMLGRAVSVEIDGSLLEPIE